jgi:hypothetical protein
VYAGGSFINFCGNAACNSGNVIVNRMAKWNGSSWSALGFGVDGPVFALNVDSGNHVYAGGRFLAACGNVACIINFIPLSNIAQWNGSAGWSALGSGTNDGVFGIQSRRGYVYAGGTFSVAGGKVSGFFGQYDARALLYLPLIAK